MSILLPFLAVTHKDGIKQAGHEPYSLFKWLLQT